MAWVDNSQLVADFGHESVKLSLVTLLDRTGTGMVGSSAKPVAVTKATSGNIKPFKNPTIPWAFMRFIFGESIMKSSRFAGKTFLPARALKTGETNCETTQPRRRSNLAQGHDFSEN